MINLKLDIEGNVLKKYPDLKVLIRVVKRIKISEVNLKLEEFKEEVSNILRTKYTLEGLKNEPIFRAYRDFFWRIGIDPTKIRPAAEALIRRVLNGRSIPRINTAVDSYNLASMITCVAIAAFDVERIDGDIIMRFAKKGEEFLGIGMDKPLVLEGREIVLTDKSRLLAVYPHRDADYSKITLHTKDLMLISCGVPNISLEWLNETIDKASEFILTFCSS